MAYRTGIVLGVSPDKNDIVRIRDKLNRFVTNLPRSAKRDSYNIAKKAGRTLQFSARSAGIRKWRGLLFNMLNRPVKAGENAYSVQIPEYGIYLDEMGEHVVSRLPRQPNINLWMWAEKKMGGMPPYMRVHPHPWISKGLENARRKVRREFMNGHVVRSTKKLVGR